MDTIKIPVLSVEEINILVEQFYKDFVYDCHSTTTKYNRSAAAKKLVEVGQSSLHQIANLIVERFPNMKTSGTSNKSVNWDLFMYVVYLIGDIRDKHCLIDGPYARDLPYGQQDIGEWHNYCLKNAAQ